MSVLFKKIIISLVLTLTLCLGVFDSAAAQNDPNPGDTFGLGQINKTVKLGGSDPREIAARIINIALGLLGIITVGLVLYGGFLYMTAGGNDEQIGTAKKYIINATIGLLIILASFAIVQFIFKSLTDATLGDQSADGGGGGNDLPLDVCDPNSANYNPKQCEAFCVAHPEYTICQNQEFYVLAITPGALDSKNELTGMSNIKIRVLFSHPLSKDINLAKAVILTEEGKSDPFLVSTSILENNRVLEVAYDGYIPGRAYTVTVNSDLKDSNGKTLKKQYSAGGVNYPSAANFTVNENFVDAVKPYLGGLMLNGVGGNNLSFNLNQNLTISGTLNDRLKAKFGGNGLIKLSITNDTGENVATDYTAPLVVNGSINSFTFNYTTKLDNRFTAGKKYTITITGYDIDSNLNTATITFTVKAAHCDNEVQDGDETGVDSGGSCGEDNGLPVIMSLDPGNGAPGNWITILGKHFGNQAGMVEFASDLNQNQKYDAEEWIKAEIVSCGSNSLSWYPNWVVVQVPPKATNISNDTASEFNGSDGHVEINGATLELTNALTFEAWVKPTDSGGYKTILAKVDSVAKQGYFFALNNLQPVVWLSGLKNPGWHSATNKVPLNTWSHLVVTYDGASIKFYINGQLNKNTPMSGSVVPTPGKKLWLGMREDFTKINQFKGGLDEVAVYNKVLPPAQIAAHFGEAQKIDGTYNTLVNEDGPLGFWRLGENKGAVASDSSTYQINGTYVGAVTLGQIGIFGPSVKKTGIGEKSAIRITVSNSNKEKVIELSDSTIDDFGPKPNGDGLFLLNTIKRPGLCRVGVTTDTEVELGGTKVTLLAGSPAAPPKVPVTAHGSGFGALNGSSKLLFGAQKNPVTGALTGGFQGEVKTNNDWTDLAVNTKVPANIQPSNYAVHVASGGESSNGVKFMVLSSKASITVPIISSIDPATTTPKSFITISGSGFGATIGQVFVADSEEHSQTCGTANAHDSCHALNVDDLPPQCGATWSDTQVIAAIPDGLKAGLHHVSLKNNLNFRTDGKITLTVLSEAPLPGICRIEPAKGPAPLPKDSKGLNLYGINLGVASVLYFWQPGAHINQPETWLHSDTDLLNGESVVKQKYANHFITLLPVGSKGTSMSTGPIKIKNLNGSFTNSVNYTVESCVGAKDFPGYHCCAKGPETGMWKKNNQACVGEAREAGYVWRFTTGIIADLPRVVEECNGVVFPSPTPRKQESTTPKADACINSTVALRFNMGMNTGSLNSNTVKVYACATSVATTTAGKIDCVKEKKPVTPLDIEYQTGANTLIIRQVPPSTPLAPNTWYQVELSEKIKSQQVTKVLGVDQMVSSTLTITKPCGSGTAYCFTFKTGSQECTLIGAGINPPQYTARQLGIIQNPSYPFDSSELFLYPKLPPSPYYYFVWGKGSQECSVINVDQYPWKWSPAKGDPQSDQATVYKSVLGTTYLNSRAVVEAVSHTAPNSVDIKAEVDVNNTKSISDIEGTDILKLANIDPGTKGYTIDNEFVLPTAASNQLSLQSSFTLQFKFSQDYSFPYYNLLDKREKSGPAIGYKILHTSSQLCLSTFEAPAANLGFKHCLTNLTPDANGIFNVLLSWNKDTKKLSWINLNPPLKQESITVDTIPNSSGVAALVTGKPPGQTGPTFFSFKYKPEPSDFNVVGGLLHFAPTSTLVVDLNDPQVTYFEPNCIESCINATVRADFNRAMDPTTFAAGFKIYKCIDGPGCNNPVAISLYSIDSDSSTYLSLRTTLKSNLDPNTYYKVALNGDDSGPAIKSIAQLKPAIVWGKPLLKTEWIFKTRPDAKPCGVSSLKVTPVELLATQVGQQNKFTVTPYSAPNACSKLGQALNKWDYSYIWGTKDEKVAKISDIKPALYANVSNACNLACVKKGSMVAKDSDLADDPICGDSKKENGEDCDVAAAGENPDVSCSLNCLRPGTTTAYSLIAQKTGDNVCGNGKIETAIGEQCDPGHTGAGEIKKDDLYCTEICLLRGASDKPTGKVGVAVCGDGVVTAGQEVCDTADNATKQFCSASCLHLGTKVSSYWCENNTSYKSTPACVSAASVCGNGKVEASEDCEPELSEPGVCSNQCLFINACGLPKPPCAKGAPGCSDKCTLLGAKITYAKASVCGDGVVGTGEEKSCELTSAASGPKAGPTQVVQAVGEGQIAAGKDYQETKVQVNTEAGQKKINGEANYQLQCGYTEYVIPTDNKQFNDCPGNDKNSLGVDGQSCCLARPHIDTTYPADGAGFADKAICRNTYIEAKFDQELRPETVTNNLLLVRGHSEANFVCPSSTQDVTNLVNQTIQVSTNKQLGFWAKVWQKITHFFQSLTGGTTSATNVKDLAEMKSITAWCANEVPITVSPTNISVNNKTITIASVAIGSLLEKNSIYGVLLRGDVGGIVSVRGVPLGAKQGLSRNDAWFFKTGADICKLKSVVVTPESYLFTKPNTTSTFFAVASTASFKKPVDNNNAQPVVPFSKDPLDDGQAVAPSDIGNSEDGGSLITPIPGVYSWVWSWEPKNNPVFSIPFADTSADQSTIIIGSKNVQGHITGIAQAIVTTDISGQDNQVNKVFSDTTSLTSLFCEHPWPAPPQYPYTDKQFNFQMSYCADAGKSDNTADDLPYLSSELSLANVPGASDSLKKIVFFTDKPDNADAIGVQIFASDVTLKEWYLKKFGPNNNMQSTVIGNYEAMTDNNNYYVQALNYVPNPGSPAEDKVYSNIYLFSINPNAANETREVFKKLLASLEFNINMTDHGYCLAPGGDVRSNPNQISSVTCSTDFDCRDADGIAKATTNGTCSNAKTKFHRDWKRLKDIQIAQDHIGGYFDAHKNDFDFKGNLAGGSFVPGYTVSHWAQSWSLLGGLVGGLPADPIDKWTNCTADDKLTCWSASSTTYFCPKFSSVYEYEYTSSTKNYLLHGPLEFFTTQDVVTQQFVDLDTFTTDRWAGCNSGAFNPFQEKCGDGILNAAEQCDPPGKIELVNQTFETITVGNCKSWSTEVSCTNDAKCGQFTVGVKDYPHKLFHVATGKTGACYHGKEKQLFAKHNTTLVQNDEYELISCNTSAECQNPHTYDVGADFQIGVSENYKVKHFSDFVDYLEKEKKYITCKTDIFNNLKPDKCLNLGQTNLVSCPVGQKATRTCSNQCSWQYDACVSTTQCGNGTVEGGEACDDGALNGTYGHCNKDADGIVGCTGLSAQYCGNKKIDFKDDDGDGVKDPNEKNYEFCETGLNGFGPAKNYDFYKEESCAWDCQGYGGYCGDGFVQKDKYEECDDGNSKDEDMCSHGCKFTPQACLEKVYGIFVTKDAAGKEITEFQVEKDGVVPPECLQIYSDNICTTANLTCAGFKEDGATDVTACNTTFNTNRITDLAATDNKPVSTVVCNGAYQGQLDKTPTNPNCGNGKIDTGEICDGGDKNDVPCIPPPGQKSCTYCASQCKQIKTVDTPAFCGNGKIDPGLNEVCEIASDGSVLKPKGLKDCSAQKLACDTSCQNDASPTFCKGNCTLAYTSCKLESEDGATVPATCPDKGSFQCTNSCTQLTEGCVSCGEKQNGAMPYLRIINPILWSWSETPAGFNNDFSVLFFKNAFLANGEPFKSNIGNYSFSKETTSINPGTFNFGGSFGASGENVLTVESSPLCSADYGFMFNSDKVNATGGQINIYASSKKAATYFPYQVNGEAASITKEIIMSPAVPPGTFRVVLKWTAAEKDAEFGGNVFNEEYSTAISVADKFSDIVSVESRFPDKFCSAMKSKQVNANDIYWFPDSRASDIILPSGFNAGSEFCSDDGGVKIGAKINTSNTYVRAFTIDTKTFGINNVLYTKPFAFFVSGIDKPIGLYKDSNLEVQIYTYHEGQKAQYSIYEPTYTFKIKKSADTSTNVAGSINYWHVFNLVKDNGTYVVKPVDKIDAAGNTIDPKTGQKIGEYQNGMLQTSFCTTLNHLPGSQCSN